MQKKPPFFWVLGILAFAFSAIDARDSSQCYSHPVGWTPPGALSQDLESYYQMRYGWAQQNGDDMEIWQDTVRLAVRIHFHSLNYGNPTDSRDGTKPDPKPVDTLTPRAFQAWAQVLFTQYEIFDYFNPESRLEVPSETREGYFDGLATRATLLDISKECFTRSVDAGGPQQPLSNIRKARMSSLSSRENKGAVFNIAGQKSVVGAEGHSNILYTK